MQGEWFPITMTLLPELLPIERLEDGASSVRSALSIATRLSKTGKLRRSGTLVESASHSNIQPLQCPTASGRAGGNGTRFVAAIRLRSRTGSQRTLERPWERGTEWFATWGATRVLPRCRRSWGFRPEPQLTCSRAFSRALPGPTTPPPRRSCRGVSYSSACAFSTTSTGMVRR